MTDIEKQVIKDFVDMMETALANANSHIGVPLDLHLRPDENSRLRDEGAKIVIRRLTSKPEYQALKASISPVSEDKKGEWKMPTPEADEYDWSKLDHGLYKIYWKDGGCSMASVGSLHSGKRWFAPTNWTSKDHNIASSCWNKVKDVKCIMSNAGFDREEEPEQPTDTQDNNGWIEHDGKSQPVDDYANVEVKFFQEEEEEDLTDLAGNFDACWIWNGRFPGDDNIIAYRIIDEPKDEKEEEGYNQKYCGSTHAFGNCPICANQKEPKKQTLLEIYDEWKIYNPAWSMRDLIALISEYLEKNK